MTALGVDLARWQNPRALPYPAWLAAGLEIVGIQVTHGPEPEPVADEHLAAAVAAHVPILFAYHWLTPGGGAKQGELFLGEVNINAYRFCALDVEQDGITAPDVLAFCDYFDKWAYTGMRLVLYGNNLLAAIIAANPELRRYLVWYADYGPYKPGTKELPLRTFDNPPPPTTYPAGLHVIARQIAGNNGRFPPYPGAIDLTVWDKVPGVPMPTMPAVMVPRGSLAGIHAINPGDTLKMVREAAAAGAPYSAVKMLNDAAALMEVKQASPTTWAYLRYFNPADDSLQGLDDWSPANEDAWCDRVLFKIYSQITPEQCRFVDWACAWNEEDPPGRWGYQKLGETFLRLGAKNEARKAAGLPYVKLAFGCLAQGTPELWEIDELVDTGLFKWMRDHFYSWDVHEGAFAWQKIDDGYGDALPSDPAHNHPGGGDVPAIPGSGSGSFRFVWTFERRLRPLGQLVPLLIGEWYPGVPGQLDRYQWYDDRLALYEYVTGFAPYNLGPTGDWPDLTPDYLAMRQHRIDIRNRVNGGSMPNVTDTDLAALKASNQADAVILAKYNPVKHTLADKSNQFVLNLFSHVFGGFKECDAAGLTAKLAAARQALYVGPALEDLPNLTADQKAALIAGL